MEESVEQSRKFTPSLNDYLIGESFLCKGRFHTLIGKPGMGKSLVLIYASLCLASGRPFFSLPTASCRVAFFACEAAISSLTRFQVAAGVMGLSWPLDGVLVPTEALDLRKPEWQKAVCDFLLQHRIDAAFIDTVNASGSGKEDAEDMGAYSEGCREIVRRTGVAIMASHHPPVAAGRGEVTRERGHGSLRGTIDASVYLEDEWDTEALVPCKVLSSGKMRDGKTDIEFGRFKIGVKEIGINNLGEMMTVPYVEPQETKAEARTQAGRRGLKRQAAMELILEVVPEADEPSDGAESETIDLMATERGISRSEISRARKKLGVKAAKVGRDWWCWFERGKKDMAAKKAGVDTA